MELTSVRHVYSKSTVGLGLAKALGVPFIDGDDLHPADNVAKMSAGHPLTDEVGIGIWTRDVPKLTP